MSSKSIQNENLIFFSNDNEWYKFRSHTWCHKPHSKLQLAGCLRFNPFQTFSPQPTLNARVKRWNKWIRAWKYWHCITVLCARHCLSTSYSTLLTEEEGGQNWTGQTWAGCGRGRGGQEQGLVVGEQLQPCLGFCLDSRLLPVNPGQPHLFDHQHENPPIWRRTWFCQCCVETFISTIPSMTFNIIWKHKYLAEKITFALLCSS